MCSVELITRTSVLLGLVTDRCHARGPSVHELSDREFSASLVLLIRGVSGWLTLGYLYGQISKALKFIIVKNCGYLHSKLYSTSDILYISEGRWQLE